MMILERILKDASSTSLGIGGLSGSLDVLSCKVVKQYPRIQDHRYTSALGCGLAPEAAVRLDR